MLKFLFGVDLVFLLFSGTDAGQITAGVHRTAADALAPEKEKPTIQERVTDILEKQTTGQ